MDGSSLKGLLFIVVTKTCRFGVKARLKDNCHLTVVVSQSSVLCFCPPLKKKYVALGLRQDSQTSLIYTELSHKDPSSWGWCKPRTGQSLWGSDKTQTTPIALGSIQTHKWSKVNYSGVWGNSYSDAMLCC